jgi:peptidoglycan/LPS O-acetylase OafA/YrhL
MVCFLISVVLREDHVLSGLLAWRPIARVGEVSYGVYLYHLFALDPALRLDAAFGLGAWSATLLMVVFSLIIAEVSFRTYERFFLSFKNKPSGKASKQSG